MNTLKSKNRLKRIIVLVLCFAVCLTANPGWNQFVEASAGLTGDVSVPPEVIDVPETEVKDSNAIETETGESDSGVGDSGVGDTGVGDTGETNTIQTDTGESGKTSEDEQDSGQKEPPSEKEPVKQENPETQTGTESETTGGVQGSPLLDRGDFNTDAIVAAGIEDEKLALAIYCSIKAQPMDFLNGNTLMCNNFSTVEELLNSFTGTIIASGQGIKNIEGISMLKSCEKWDLSNNDIKDIRPLSITKAVNESDVAHNEKRYYGIENRNMEVNLEENPIQKYPLWVGGRFNFNPQLASKVVMLDSEVLKYVTNGTEGFAGTYTIPLSFYGGDVQVDIRPDTIGILESDKENPTGTELKVPEGLIYSLDLTDIKGSGKIQVAMGAGTESRMNWFLTNNSGIDSVQAVSSTFAWQIPFVIEMYTKVEKDAVNTTHQITLVKTGQDDVKPKAGAEYTLYKKKGANIAPESDTQIGGTYITDKKGEINVEVLEVGEYYFLEETPPEGYDKNPNPTSFSVSDGTLAIEGGIGNIIDTKENQGVQKLEDGSFVLGGKMKADASDEEKAKRTIGLNISAPLKGGDLESIGLEWTAGNHNGTAGKMTYCVGSGNSTSTITYFPTSAAAEAAAEAKLAEARDLYQNVKVSASFTQHLVAGQTDPLKPVDVSLAVLKKLIYPTGNEVKSIDEGKFAFSLKSDPKYPQTPKLPTPLTVVNGADGKAKFETISLGGEITQNNHAPDEKGNYVYHYLINEHDGGDPNYIYDKNVIKAAVSIGKVNGTDILEVKSITYTSDDGTSDTDYARFVNTLLAVPFQFYKVDGNDHNMFLEGVEFTLYECGAKHQEGEQHDDEMVTNEKDNCWKERDIVLSDDKGLVDFKDIPSGDYQLVETKTNSGYGLPFGQWRIRVVATDKEPIAITAAGNSLPPAFIKENEEGKFIYKLPNFKNTKLPLAGGSGTRIFSIVGVGVILLAIILMFRTERVSKKRKGETK